MNLGFEGTTVVITGAGGGIGRAAALALASEGADVIVVDRSDRAASETAELVRELGRRARMEACDVRDPNVGERILSAAGELGEITALVNAAGIAPAAPVELLSAADWTATLETNLTGAWHTCQAVVKHWISRGTCGAVVNVASNNAFYAEPNLAAYCASKGGLVALTRAMALELGHRGIRVNCVCPGFVDTALIAPAAAGTASRAALGALHALNRIADPAEIANCIVFLASQAASFITGAELVADGGMSIGVQRISQPST